MILKESKQFNYKDKKKEIEELSQKSRLLLEKGAAYQNDIGWMTSAIAGYINFPGFGVTYNFTLYQKTIEENSYKYKFYDTAEKNIRDCKIYSPFSHYKGNGFEFKRTIGPKREDTISVSLFDDYKKIKTTFIHNYTDIWYYTNIFYRDRNNLFIKDNKNNKWSGTSENLFHEATHYATKTKNPFDVSKFLGDFYEVQKKGTGYVMGTLREWQKLVPKGEGHLTPFILHKKKPVAL